MVATTDARPPRRSFPGVWVCPGGHIERSDLSIVRAGLREVAEETGLALDADSARVLCLWESCFPIDLSVRRRRRWLLLLRGVPGAHDGAAQLGPPLRQHVVIYISARLAHGDSDVRIQEAEVAAAAWLTAREVSRLVAGDVGEEDVVSAIAVLPRPPGAAAGEWGHAADAASVALVPVSLQVHADVGMHFCMRPCACPNVVSPQSVYARLAEGTRFALAVWAATAADYSGSEL